MRRAERDRFLVGEMLRHLVLIRRIAAPGRTTIERDAISRYALEHAIELTSEASKHVSAGFRAANPQVRWQGVRAVRAALAHPYDEGAEPVRIDHLWAFVKNDAPLLEKQLKWAKFGVA